jgi:hypothetical protein
MGKQGMYSVVGMDGHILKKRAGLKNGTSSIRA